MIEMKLQIIFRLLEMLGLLFGLQNLPDGRPRFAAFVSALVRSDQSSRWLDVVVEKENDRSLSRRRHRAIGWIDRCARARSRKQRNVGDRRADSAARRGAPTFRAAGR